MELGLALLERLEGDVVLSPYSLARALAVIRLGATGATRAALDELLGAEPVPEIGGLELAQAAWLADGFGPGPALTLETGPLDVDAVNAWARAKTHGMIQRVVERFEPDEILAITDAVFFDGKWAQPFTIAGPRRFEGAGEVTMMTVHGWFEHADHEAVRLRYGHGDLRFVAVLGDTLRRDLTWRSSEGDVELPRFSAGNQLDLKGPLCDLGLGPAFADGHDLDGLVTGAGPKALSGVDQAARVEVDERGTRAAAVTVAGVRLVSLRSDTFHITFDRPFTWAVEHAPTGTLLFVGRVLNPSERSD
jgi:serine protease inhibitor